MVLLSLGTGTSLQYIRGKSLDWGLAQWARPMVSLVLDGAAGIVDYQCRQLLGDRYHRLAPVFPPGATVPLDAVEKVPYMVELAESLPLDDTIAWLRRAWLDPSSPRQSSAPEKP